LVGRTRPADQLSAKALLPIRTDVGQRLADPGERDLVVPSLVDLATGIADLVHDGIIKGSHVLRGDFEPEPIGVPSVVDYLDLKPDHVKKQSDGFIFAALEEQVRSQTNGRLSPDLSSVARKERVVVQHLGVGPSLFLIAAAAEPARCHDPHRPLHESFRRTYQAPLTVGRCTTQVRDRVRPIRRLGDPGTDRPGHIGGTSTRESPRSAENY
jgi:hypothetical protein